MRFHVWHTAGGWCRVHVSIRDVQTQQVENRGRLFLRPAEWDAMRRALGHSGLRYDVTEERAA